MINVEVSFPAEIEKKINKFSNILRVCSCVVYFLVVHFTLICSNVCQYTLQSTSPKIDYDRNKLLTD